MSTLPTSSSSFEYSADLNVRYSTRVPSLHIPPELFQPIIAFIDDRSSLYALTLSSHFLRHEAEPYLYASPMSPSPSTQHPKSTSKSRPKLRPTDEPATHIAFLRTITTIPRLAALVRAYHSPSVLIHGDSQLWELTKRGLGMMIGLRELRLRTFDGRPAAASLLLRASQASDGRGRGFGFSRGHVPSNGNVGIYAHDLGPVSFQLHALHWGCHSDEEAIAKFLTEQPQIRELYLEIRTGYKHLFEISPFHSNSSSPSTSSIPVPHLEFLGGNRSTIEAFLPRRRITRLAWIPDIEDSIVDPLLSPVADEMHRVKILEFGGYFMRPHFRKLAGQLGALEVLQLVGAYGDELALLKTLPNLRSLILSIPGTSRDSPISSESPEARNNAVRTLFANCGRLQCVDLAMDRGYVNGSGELNRDYGAVYYLRWERPSHLECFARGDGGNVLTPADNLTGAEDADAEDVVEAEGRLDFNLKADGSPGTLQLGEPVLLSIDQVLAERLMRHY